LQNNNARRVSCIDTVRQSSIELAGTALKRMLPELVVSKQKLRQAEGISLIRSKREERESGSGVQFQTIRDVRAARPEAVGGSTSVREEERELSAADHRPSEFGLPYGQDRLVPIYLATLAVQQKSQAVRFRSGAEMLDTFGMSKGGKEYRRLVEAFERIFGATIFFGSDRVTGRAKVVQRSRFNFLREARIWYHRHADQSALSEEFENTVVLSDEFYSEIAAHPIPTDLEAVRVLAGAPAVLDLFMWLSYRCHIAQREENIPIFGSYGLAHQLGSIEYSRRRRFRVKLEQWLSSIRALWPDCPAHITPEGEYLAIRPATAVTGKEA
jgi:hypothetical protein